MGQRVVITGIGIVSSLGHNLPDVASSLRSGRSGIGSYPSWRDKGLWVWIGGRLDGIEALEASADLPRTTRALLADVGLYAVLAARAAMSQAELDAATRASARTACLVGAGITSPSVIHAAAEMLDRGQQRRVSPYTLFQVMASNPSAAVARVLGIGGRSYSIASACATSAHNIGHGFELIRAGVLDAAVAGGAEAIDVLTTASFCAMRTALSEKHQAEPTRASRPFDRRRDGFVISGGAGVVVLESLDRARARGARIHAEVVGYGANTAPGDAVRPEEEGQVVEACMRAALEDAGLEPAAVDYVNAHGTATVVGDIVEARAIRRLFGARPPRMSSTKSLGGHALGAAGAHELIHCVAMLQGGFVAPSANVDDLDPECEGAGVVTAMTEAPLAVALTNSFGFGGTNAALVLRRWDG